MKRNFDARRPAFLPSIRRTVILAVAVLIASDAHAQAIPGLALSGDMRVRLEQDWDSRTETGAKRADRLRTRVRLRVNAAEDLGDGLWLFARVRTDTPNSQQNANVTFADFDGNPRDEMKIVADRYSVAWQGKAAAVEVGRMPFPYFTQNEYFWDADINPLGVGGSVTLALPGTTRLRTNAGGFALPVGLAHYSGRLYAGQAVLTRGGATLAAGFFRFQADPRNPDRLTLLDGNGDRDYGIVALNGQYRTRAFGEPLALGADLYRNVEGYSASPDPISRAAHDQRTGYVLSAVAGSTAARRFQLGYRYFHMEKLAVDASYSHDDLARLGTARQAALTDLAGSDLFANYAVNRRIVVGMRLILAHRITTIEDGKRVRLDAVYAF